VTVTIELFYSPMCQHCPKAKKVLMEIAEEFSGKIRVEEVNILSSTGIERAENYGFKGVPAIVINRKAKISGLPSKEKLRMIIQRELESS